MRRYAAGTVLLALMAGAGCGSTTSTSGVRVATLAAVAENLAKARTYLISMTTGATSSGVDIHVARTGSVNVAEHTSEIDAGGRAQMLTVAGRTYVRIPENPFGGPTTVFPGLPGKTWLVMSTPPDLSDSPFSDLLSTTGAPFNGSAIVDRLRELPNALTTVGHGTVRGMPTTHFKVTVKASALGGTWSTPAASVPIDLDVDTHGLLRRLSLILPGLPGNGELTMTIEFYGFGTPVKVVAPPPNQVADFNAFLRAMQLGHVFKPGRTSLPALSSAG